MVIESNAALYFLLAMRSDLIIVHPQIVLCGIRYTRNRFMPDGELTMAHLTPPGDEEPRAVTTLDAQNDIQCWDIEKILKK